MSRLFTLIVVASAMLVAPTSLASAAPVTINFKGQWSFFDPPFDAPEFHAAMTAAGVTDATPLSLSLTFNDAAISPTGVYAGGLLGGELTVGSLSYSIRQSAFDLSRTCAGNVCSGAAHVFTHIFGPTLSAGTRTFYPNFIQFDSFLQYSPANSLSASLAGATWQNPFIFISFWNQRVVPPRFGSSGDMGFSDLRFESASIPEPATLPLVLGALVVRYASRRIGARF